MVADCSQSPQPMSPADIEQQLIARALLERARIRGSFLEWCRAALPLLGIETPIAAHHRLVIDEFQRAADRGNARTIICMPPGSAKSTYTSILGPPWFLSPGNRTILSCSYAYELVQSFGRKARNIVENKELAPLLGYEISSWSKAAGEWETTNGGRYFCAGVNAGIAGHRADLGLIDDPIGSREDAMSELYRKKLWGWFWDDFMPRLKPGGSVFIIANRRHEEDLVGMLLARYPADWKLIKLPLVVDTREQESCDPLHRRIGQWLWPEYFNEQKVVDARKSEDFWGLQQQDPHPPEGDLIKWQWLEPVLYYRYVDLPSDLRTYVGSDHSCKDEDVAKGDPHCLIPGGIDGQGDLWIYPDVWWKREDTGVLVEAMLDMAQRRSPVEWFAENEHIRKSIAPFLRRRMQERNIWFPITPIPSTKDLVSRSSSIRGLMQNKRVHLPAFAPWWPVAKNELLSFPYGKTDDFVAALAKLGQGIARMNAPRMARQDPRELQVLTPTPPCITFRSLRESARRLELANQPRYNGR